MKTAILQSLIPNSGPKWVCRTRMCKETFRVTLHIHNLKKNLFIIRIHVHSTQQK